MIAQRVLDLIDMIDDTGQTVICVGQWQQIIEELIVMA